MIASARRLAWVTALATLWALCGCAETGLAPPRPPETIAQAGRSAGQTYQNPELGLVWLLPGGFRPFGLASEGNRLSGWESADHRLAGLLWLLPGPAGDGPAAWGQRAAAGLGWREEAGRAVAWQGRACWDLTASSAGKTYRARALPLPQGLLVVAAGGEAARAAAQRGPAMEIIEGLRLWPPAELLHTVKRGGETLEQVALWYTGRASNWSKLKEYNRMSETGLRPGQELLIPRALVWRLDPMPAWMGRQGQAAAPPAAGSGKTAPALSAVPPPDDAGEGLGEVELTPAGPK